MCTPRDLPPSTASTAPGPATASCLLGSHCKVGPALSLQQVVQCNVVLAAWRQACSASTASRVWGAYSSADIQQLLAGRQHQAATSAASTPSHVPTRVDLSALLGAQLRCQLGAPSGGRHAQPVALCARQGTWVAHACKLLTNSDAQFRGRQAEGVTTRSEGSKACAAQL